jgi:dUTP pyrophosphatase
VPDIVVTRRDPALPLPRFETAGSVGFDIAAREEVVVQPGEIKLVPGNIIVKVPDGYVLLIFPRSSLPRRKSLVCPHSVGVIDQDYHGPEDEICVQVQNVGRGPVVVERGERIAQGIFVKCERAVWRELAVMDAKSRGGFGSTGM